MERKYHFKHRTSHDIEKPQTLEEINQLKTPDIQVFEGKTGWFWLAEFNETVSNNKQNQSKKS